MQEVSREKATSELVQLINKNYGKDELEISINYEKGGRQDEKVF